MSLETTLTKTNNKRTPEDDAQYFGVYLNMAQHNVFQILNEINSRFKKLGFSDLADDEYIDQDFRINNANKSTQKHSIIEVFNPTHKFHQLYAVKVFRAMNRYLPFLKVFEQQVIDEEESENDLIPIDFMELYEFLITILHELVLFRNSYSHYIALDEAGNRCDYKKEVSHIACYQLFKFFKLAPKYTWQRFRSTDEKLSDGHELGDFKHLDDYILFSGQELTAQGLFFFTCLFLEKKYAYIFLKRFNGFKNESTQPFKATLRAFTAYTIRLPHEKLIVEDPKQALLLDMLNELNKIPKELYRHLSIGDQEEFDTINEQSLLNILNNTDESSYDDIDCLLEKIVPLRRSDDRFAYFALRYLEETEAFSKIKFQIRLGSLEHEPYDKKIIGQVQARTIQFPINAFGKLSLLLEEDKILEQITNTLSEKEKEGLSFERFNPHYHIENNKIGILLPINEDFHASKVTSNQKGKLKINHVKPTAFISIHELPKIVLITMLCENKGKNSGQDIEHHIFSFMREYRSKFLSLSSLESIAAQLKYEPLQLTRRNDNLKKVKNRTPVFEFEKRKEYQSFIKQRREILQGHIGDKIKVTELPGRIKDYLLNIEDVSMVKRNSHHIKSSITEVKEKIKEIEKNKLPKIGEIATYIARDIISLVIEEELKQKITSIYYNYLQKYIAYFANEKNNLISLCRELNLFDQAKGHVFLTEGLIKQSNSVLEFYDNYLGKKLRWLERNFIKTTREGAKKKVNYIIPELIPVPYKMQKKLNQTFEINNWIVNKRDAVIDLPTTIFDEKINTLLRMRLKEGEYTNEDKFARLLGQYLKGDEQPFYSYKRIYKLLGKNGKDSLIDVRKFKHSAIKKKFGSLVEQNEKYIRFIQTKDRIVRLMCENLIVIDKDLGFEGQFSLANIYPGSTYNPLDLPVSFTQSLRINKNKSVILTAEDTESWKEEVKLSRVENGDGVKGFVWTLKDSGFFRKILYDKRLTNLVEYFDVSQISVNVLLFELREYDRYRELVFDKIFELEKAIVLKDQKGLWELNKKKLNNFNEIQFKVYIEWLECNGFADENLNELSVLRNKFSHNQYPEHVVFNLPIIGETQQKLFDENSNKKDWLNLNYTSVAKQLYNFVELNINDLVKRINC
ncbi:type VI-B CRISPR-associated RNA-guided ribonuclease Cas13b [Pedobacter cryoconitis]|uniref:Uncharacterized protein n=1 Tax=Pedobacter cryoconitis TaxID=188932 RepID=A0A7X0J820_9SPHI|nr:type VI-B CRISPR-associated RNA-guided ribonuclease Cas13b [Pedobacter cryoconitis]MBB6502810.1 hypothetical protein [Pedobacter cryoconitis]